NNQPNSSWQNQQSRASGMNSQGNQFGNQQFGNQQFGNQAGNQDDIVHFQGHERAALGVTLAEHQSGAVLVSNVFPNSPAAHAGLRSGDRITSVNQQPIRSYRDLIRIIGNSSPNSQVRLHIDRNGQSQTMTATLASPQSLEHASAQQGYSNPSSDEQSRFYRGNHSSNQNSGQ
ncbi:MAG TPA: PDZ domain-containing protein, partial [Pirellulales bacterium]|nr:PDZ domain-containing protein [Pirellulales bacterium]